MTEEGRKFVLWAEKWIAVATLGKNGIGGSAFLVFGKEMTVSGCERVICYTEEKVILGMKGGKLVVSGKELTVATFFGNEIKICGDVRAAFFAKNGENKDDSR